MRIGLARRQEVRDAARLVVDARAAESLEVDLLVGDGLDHVRPGDEHVARPVDHDHEVGDGRRVDRPAGAGPQHQRELRDDAGDQRVAQEDIGVAAEGDDAFLDARAAGVGQADDRRAVLQRQVHDLQIFSACASDSEPPKTVKSCA